MTEATRKSGREVVGTGTLDLALHVLEYLTAQPQPVALTQIAKAFETSKATVYRHLVALERHGFVRQEAETNRYEPGVALLRLGEAVRERFDVAGAARPEMSLLCSHTGQAVTLCRMIDGRLIVLDLLHGSTVVEFGTRPGTEIPIHATAHGKIWLAFGGAQLPADLATAEHRRWTAHTITDPAAMQRDIALVRQRGWAVAPDEVIVAVNALAAPVFNHNNTLVGSVAIVGATQFIAAEPSNEQIAEVVATGRRISERIGWRSKT